MEQFAADVKGAPLTTTEPTTELLPVLTRIDPAHFGTATSLAFGEVRGRGVLVSGGTDRTVRLWDPAAGTELGTPLVGHTGRVWAVAVGQLDGRTVAASAGDDRTVRLWDLDTGASIGRPFVGHRDTILALTFCGRGGRTLIASAGRDSTVRLWDPLTGGEAAPPLTGHTDWIRSLVAVRSGDRNVLVSACDDRTLRFWNIDTGRELGEPVTLDGPVSAVAVGELDHLPIMATPDGDHGILLWDPLRRSQRGRLVGHTGPVRSLAFGKVGDRTVLASGALDGSILLWDVTAGAARSAVPLTGHSDGVFTVVFGKVDDRPMLASAGADRTIRLWDPDFGVEIGEPLTRHSDEVRAVVFAEAGGRTVVASGGEDRTVRLWDPVTGAGVGEPLVGHDDAVVSLAFGRVGHRPILAAATPAGPIRLWDLDDGNHYGRPFLVSRSGPYAMAFGQVGSEPILAAATNGVIELLDVRREARSGSLLFGHDGAISALAFGEIGRLPILASGGHDQTVRLWDPRTRQQLSQLDGHRDAVRSVALSSGGSGAILASADDNGVILLWDVTSGGSLLATFDAHDGGVRSLAFGRIDGRRFLASCGADGTVRLWDLATRTQLGEPLRGHAGPVRSVAFGKVGDHPLLASGGSDGTVLVRTDHPAAFPNAGPPADPESVAAAPDPVDVEPPASRTEALAVRDDTSAHDALNREILAGHLYGLLDQLTAPGAPGDEAGGSAVIHVDGRWGSGKTTLVTLLRRRLAEPAGHLSEPIVIPYDAWRESAVAPEWWSLATAVNRAVRQERAGVTRLLMTVVGTALRVLRSLPVLVSLVLLLAVVGTRLAGVWRESQTVGSWLTVLTAVAALGLAAGRVLFWTSPAFGRLYARADDNPLGEIASIIGRLRRWSPRIHRPHRLADTALALWLVLVLLVAARTVLGLDPARKSLAHTGSWLGDHWPAALVTLLVMVGVAASWRPRNSTTARATEPVDPKPGPVARLLARLPRRVRRAWAVGLTVTAGAAVWTAASLPLPAWSAWHPEVWAAGLVLLGVGGHAWWTARGTGHPKRPIVLVIDDLDRCTADRTVKLLETVHTLLRSRTEPLFLPRWRAPAPLIVLVLADGRWVRTAFETSYQVFERLGSPAHGLGADFLQKLFDHTVLVPALAADQVTDLLRAVTGSDATAPPIGPASAAPAGPAFTGPAATGPTSPAPAGQPGRDAGPAEPIGPSPARTRAAIDLLDSSDPGALRSTEVNSAIDDLDLSPADAARVETHRVEREATAAALDRRVAHLLLDYTALMPANPRLVKRVANAWGMLNAVQSHLHPGRPDDAAPQDHLARAAILFVRFPSLVDDLLSCPEPPTLDAGPEPSPHYPPPQPSPWLRPDVLQLLTTADGDRIPPAAIARCYGREFPPAPADPTAPAGDPEAPTPAAAGNEGTSATPE